MTDPPRNRIVIQTPSSYRDRGNLPPNRRNAELWIAISVLVAAALATFLALFLTSRPFDPMNASLAPQQIVPSSPIFTPSPRPSPSTSATPQTRPSAEPAPSVSSGETNVLVDDASIQSRIDKALSSDAVLSKLDISTLVENGKVTIVGSVQSAELKQRVERTIRSIRGVTAVDDQLVVTEATPQ